MQITAYGLLTHLPERSNTEDTHIALETNKHIIYVILYDQAGIIILNNHVPINVAISIVQSVHNC